MGVGVLVSDDDVRLELSALQAIRTLSPNMAGNVSKRAEMLWRDPSFTLESTWAWAKHIKFVALLRFLMNQSSATHWEWLRAVRGPIPTKFATDDEVCDWISLTYVLDEDDMLLSWFDRTPHLSPQVRQLVMLRIVPVLQKHDRWEEAGRLIGDPKATVERLIIRFQVNEPNVSPANTQRFIEKLNLLVKMLVAAKRGGEVAAFKDRVCALVPSSRSEFDALEI